MVKSPKHRMHHINSWNSSDLPVYRKQKSHPYWMGFCFAASFYFSSTTLYCTYYQHFVRFLLLLLPQRYEFSSKSQLSIALMFKLIGCCCYRKGTNFQANHNGSRPALTSLVVVVATAKVRIFKQITTEILRYFNLHMLLLLPQRYEFSSKSQHIKVEVIGNISCCCYRKGTNFQANHNSDQTKKHSTEVVVATAKVRIFKQITTRDSWLFFLFRLLLLPQRYEFSSKSQLNLFNLVPVNGCCCYRKGTNFQANHNTLM